jgi:hypothetical protein
LLAKERMTGGSFCDRARYDSAIPPAEAFMRTIVFAASLVVAFAAGMALTPSPLLAANADAPYSNVDKRNDAGNDTGNSKVEGLNKGQLDENQKPPAMGSQPSAQPAK